jgi:hypothetical protein
MRGDGSVKKDKKPNKIEKPKTDILDIPGRTIQVPTNDRQVRYGTVGSGLDLGRLVWPKDKHVFSSQALPTLDIHKQLPGRATTVKELGPAGGVQKNIL